MMGSPTNFKALKALQAPAVLATWVCESRSGLGARFLLDAEAERSLPVEIREGLEGDAACLLVGDFGGGGGALKDRLGQGEVLLEWIVPGKLAPWIHFCNQQLERQRRCALVTVVGIEGEAMPYSLGDRFAYDDQSHHGLLPIDPGLSVALTRATARALQGGAAFRERFEVPGGAVVVIVEPLDPALGA